MSLPAIAITTGDPAGIGPEVSLRAIPEVLAFCRPQLIGNRAVLQQVAAKIGVDLPAVPILDPAGDFSAVQPGQICAENGSASYLYVTTGIDLAIEGKVAGVVTGPIQKESWHLAGIPFPGHTELLASRTHSSNVRMMLTAPQISCVLVTVHVGYAEVPRLLTTEGIFESIQMGHEVVSRIRQRKARVTVCGLNPHAGEHGLFGQQEEERIIQPAIDRARKAGIEVQGPLPPDTAFTAAKRLETDVYICMYHDQGLIPLKTLAFDDAVNVTLGLPIVRTSVDHGTAMDIAWQGIAEHTSMVQAIRLAVQLASPGEV